MTPQQQTIHTDTDGNCLAAAICSILEIGIEQFPALPPICPDWKHLTNQFLNEIGWNLVFINYPPELIKGYHLIIGGPEERRHCVVALNGIVVHDPSPLRNLDSPPLEDPFIGLLYKIVE